MKEPIKTVGILTSGGDAPGMNATVRAVVRAGLKNGLRMVGIKRGYCGLLNSEFEELNLRSVSDIIQRGGTVLYSARCPEFVEEKYQLKARDNCIAAGIDAIVTIGGDGTFKGALSLCNMGVPCIGIPGTIDNDISSSEYTIGFDTALNTVVQMVDRIRDTSQSHDRCSVVEVMGRNSGHIALNAGIACGAIAVLVPEIEFDLNRDVILKMITSLANGKKNFIIMVAEGVAKASDIAQEIERKTGIHTNSIVLGHVQRGGSPTAMERIVASQMGHRAIELLYGGISNRVVVYKGGKVTDFSIFEALSMKKTIDFQLYRVANDISI